ncbi:MAG: acyl-CoA synthetase (AMP-forming)/AMP-acid ligase II [Halieaceae bacterium]|jgi:acyl-CoA synthetase (AMP-forming)/AMP-acid ligase II
MSKHYNLADMFEMVADTVPDRAALVCGESRSSFAQLERRANQLAHYLAEQGVGRDDHVGLYLYNCNEYLEAMLACFKLRAVPININYRYVEEELLYIFDNANLVACIHQREFIGAIVEIRHSASALTTLICVDDDSGQDLATLASVEYEVAIGGHSDRRDFSERADEDLFILYTGGTTGMPKGVIWPHKNVFFAAMGGGGFFHPDGPVTTPEAIVNRIGDFPIVGMALAPLMHGACWWYACIQLLAGNTVVLNPSRSLNGEQVWDIVAAEKVNAISIVGDAMAIPLLDSLAENPGRWDLTSVFSIGSGGAVFSTSKQESFKRHFPDCFITNAFGSSESGNMGMDSGEQKTEGGLGNVMKTAFMDVILDREGEPHRHCEVGESGIFARSGYIPVGYYNDPEKTAKTFVEVDGQIWLLTGDEAQLEVDESISIFGRGSNCINSGGEKIFPEEVEQALKNNPDIFDALVVATPDERWGSRVTAVISTRAGKQLSLDEVMNTAREHIAAYKVPRELHIVPEVPRAPSGKPAYKKAVEMIESGNYRIAN